MKATKINLNDAYVITTPRHGDERGFFIESFNHRDFSQVVDAEFVQDNHSKSSKGVLRGLHYQIEHAQGKLVRCTHGAVFDAIVEFDRSLMWNDSDIGIIWGNYGDPVLSLKDQSAKSFKECDKYE